MPNTTEETSDNSSLKEENDQLKDNLQKLSLQLFNFQEKYMKEKEKFESDIIKQNSIDVDKLKTELAKEKIKVDEANEKVAEIKGDFNALKKIVNDKIRDGIQKEMTEKIHSIYTPQILEICSNVEENFGGNMERLRSIINTMDANIDFNSVHRLNSMTDQIINEAISIRVILNLDTSIYGEIGINGMSEENEESFIQMLEEISTEDFNIGDETNE